MRNDKWISRMAAEHGMIAPIGDYERSEHLGGLFSSCVFKNRQACSINNEANLTGGENIGGAEGVTTPTADDGDDDDGDGDSDPDRRKEFKHKAIVGKSQSIVVSEKTKRRDGAVEGKTTMSKSLATPLPPLALPKEGYVRLSQIIGDPFAEPPIPPVIPVSKSSWWAGCKSGRYPAPVKLGPRTTAWRVTDIRALIEQSS